MRRECGKGGNAQLRKHSKGPYQFLSNSERNNLRIVVGILRVLIR